MASRAETMAPRALSLDLPVAGCFGADESERGKLAHSAWGAHLRVPLPETGATPHSGAIVMINSWLENRFPLTCFTVDGALHVSFSIDGPETDNQLLLRTLATYAAQVINQHDSSEATAWVAFSYAVAEREACEPPLQDRIEVDLRQS